MRFNSLKFAIVLAMLLCIAAVSVFAELLPYPSSMSRVPTPWADTPYDSVLSKTWQGIKSRNIIKYGTGMIHRPKSDQPNDAVSEGISYGMFLALYSHDQTYFNSIWDAGEKYMWNAGGYYDWRRSSTGGAIGNGPASDADQDIALLLIFADQLVQNNIWKPYTSVKGATYAVRARTLLNTIRTTMIAANNSLLPGHWGESGTINPGYFAPAFYRVFAEFDSANKSRWDELIEGCYAMIAKSPGYSKGLVPDWFNFDGKSTGGAGYNAYFNGDALYRDAIRVYWRLGTDYLWYGEPRAKTFLDNATAFIEGLGGARQANFFDMNGTLLPRTDGEKLAGGTIPRTRREHSCLTVGMWAIAAMVSGGTSLAQSYSDELLKFYAKGSDFWGNANISPVTIDTLNIKPDSPGSKETLLNVQVAEDTLHNEMYFEQFLAWFGASVLGGVFTNVWADLKDGIIPTGPPTWKSSPKLTPDSHIIDASDANRGPLRVTASFSRSVNWTVTVKRDTTGGETRVFTANSDTVDISWSGMSETGSYMSRGFYTVTVNATGLADPPYTTRVWLGRPYSGNPNIRNGNHLLIDDFADGDLIPYIGNQWKSFLDANERPNVGLSTGQLNVVKDGGKDWLRWLYRLDENGLGFDPYAALEWNCGNLDLSGIDTLIFIARSAGGNINVSVQLISSDFAPDDYKFFEDTVVIGAASVKHRLPLNASNFKQRFNDNSKNIANTLAAMIGIRFQVQYPKGSTNTIMIDSIYLAGSDAAISRLYKYEEPPEYMAPPDGPMGVKLRASQPNKYSIKRSAGQVRITLPQDMAGADVIITNVKGKVVRRISVPTSGRLDIRHNNLAAGVYIVNIKKVGVTGLMLPLTFTR